MLLYKGTIRTGSPDVDTSIRIYSGTPGLPLFDRKGDKFHNRYGVTPDTSGVFTTGVPEETHCSNETYHHWDAGPLRILIEHPRYRQVDTAFSKEEMKAMERDSSGRWILPDFHLTPK